MAVKHEFHAVARARGRRSITQLPAAPSGPLGDVGAVDGDGSRLGSLIAIAAAVGASRNFDDLLELAAEEARHALSAASLSISRWDRDRNLLRTLINVGDLGPGEERFPQNEVYALEDYPEVADTLLRGQPYVRAAGDPMAGSGRDVCEALNKGCEAGVPIMFQDVTWGELWASQAVGAPRFAASDIDFMRAVAGHVAAGIVHAEYLTRLESLAYTDPLTGLSNRRRLEERLRDALAADGDVALLICDVDGLKAVNDSAGHAAGDDLLVRVAGALQAAAAPAGALTARFGGDEFAVLLTGLPPATAVLVAESANAALRDSATSASLSCGVATSALTRDPVALLRAADLAQYAAKRAGEGEVRLAERTTSVPGHAHGPNDRRAIRRLASERSTAVAATALRTLDESLAGTDALPRLTVIAEDYADLVGAAGWAICNARGGTVTTSAGAQRSAAALRAGVPVSGQPCGLQHLAPAALLLRTAGQVMVAHDDLANQPAERRILDAVGADAVLLVGAAGHLLELYGAPGPLRDVATTVSLLARVAVGAGGQQAVS